MAAGEPSFVYFYFKKDVIFYRRIRYGCYHILKDNMTLFVILSCIRKYSEVCSSDKCYMVVMNLLTFFARIFCLLYSS